MSAVGTPAIADISAISWTSSKPAVATVTGGTGADLGKATITPAGVGSTSITAQVGDVKKTISVNVKDKAIEVTSIGIERKSRSSYSGVLSVSLNAKDDKSFDSVTLRAVTAPNDTEYTLEWTSNNTDLITIANDDTAKAEITVTPVTGKLGTAVLTVTAASSNGAVKKSQVTINCKPAAEDNRNPVAYVYVKEGNKTIGSSSIPYGTEKTYTIQLLAADNSTDATIQDIIVGSSNPSIIEVKSYAAGTFALTGKNESTAIVTVWSQDGSGRLKTLNITCTPVPTTTLVVKKDNAEFPANTTYETYYSNGAPARDPLEFTVETSAGSLTFIFIFKVKGIESSDTLTAIIIAENKSGAFPMTESSLA